MIGSIFKALTSSKPKRRTSTAVKMVKAARTGARVGAKVGQSSKKSMDRAS